MKTIIGKQIIGVTTISYDGKSVNLPTWNRPKIIVEMPIGYCEIGTIIHINNSDKEDVFGSYRVFDIRPIAFSQNVNAFLKPI